MDRNAELVRKWKATATNAIFLWPEDITDDDRRSTISVVVNNPKTYDKRPWRRFNLYRVGMSCADYIRAVVDSGIGTENEAIQDLAWDNNHEYIRWRPTLKETLIVVEIADYFEAEIVRMAKTAMQTVAYSNGQSVLVTVKNKETSFTRHELEKEISDLRRKSRNRCALTGYDFGMESNNPHLKPSLDRKDSHLGYVKGNLQIVTRAANFFKSASDEVDWALKAEAMRQMVLAMEARETNQC